MRTSTPAWVQLLIRLVRRTISIICIPRNMILGSDMERAGWIQQRRSACKNSSAGARWGCILNIWLCHACGGVQNQWFPCYVLQGKPTGENTRSCHCECPAMIRLPNNGCYNTEHRVTHNHVLMETCGETAFWPSHRHIDMFTKDLVKQSVTYVWSCH
jgi:hypothetical protein